MYQFCLARLPKRRLAFINKFQYPRELRGSGNGCAHTDARGEGEPPQGRALKSQLPEFLPVASIIDDVSRNWKNNGLRAVFFAAMLFHLLARDKTITVLIYSAKHAEMTIGKFV